MKLTKQLLKTLLLLFACGAIISSFTLLYENVKQFDLMTPCLYAEFKVPNKSTEFGFPMTFLARIDWVRMIGCGPITGKFSSYSFCPFRFMVDAIFFAAMISPLFFIIRHRIIKEKEQEK